MYLVLLQLFQAVRLATDHWPLTTSPSLATWPALHLESLVLHFPAASERGQFLIPRYTRPEMARIWSDENRFRTWLAVEVAATETLAEAGIVPNDAARAIRERADFNLGRIHEIEAEVRH